MEAATVAIERYQDVLPAVAVRVNETERTLLFDTGVGVTVIGTALAAELGIEPYGRLSGHRMSGERVDMRQVDGVRFEVGGRSLTPPTTGVLDVAALLPEGWPPVDGVLGLDAFLAQPLTIDLPGRALVLETRATLVRRTGAMEELTARVARPVQGAACELHVAATWGGRTWWLLLDSGNAAPVLLAEHTGVEADEDGAAGVAVLDLGGAEPWEGEVLVQDLILDGNLGQTFLADHVVTIDLAAGRIWACRR